MKLEQRKSISLEREQNGDVIALIVRGKRYGKNRGTLEIPEIIADDIDLCDLNFRIILNFIDAGRMGVVFRAIQNIKGGQWEAVVMVRNTAVGWNKPKNMYTYADEVEKSVKQREQSIQDVTFLVIDKRPEHILIAYTIFAKGETVGELLNDALEKSEGFLPVL